MANISNTYEGLSHSYSMWYPKSTWLFPQANNFKLWSWLFSQYMFHRSFPAKYPNPSVIEIHRTFLQDYLGQSKNTLRACIEYMCEIQVLSATRNSNLYNLHIGYVLGIISLINSTNAAERDKILEIVELFEAGDKKALQNKGLKEVTNFNPPTVSAISPEDQNLEDGQFLNKDQILDKKDQILDKDQFLPPKSGQILDKDQILDAMGSNFDPESQFLTLVMQNIPSKWDGDVVLSFKSGKIDKTTLICPENSSSDGSIFDPNRVNFWTLTGQILDKKGQILDTVYNINNKIIKHNTNFEKIEIENGLLREQINVLLEKNQNNQVEAFASSSSLENSNVWIEENEEGNVTEDDNKLQMGYDIFGEFDWYTKRELELFAQEKLKDPIINMVYRLIKDKFEDGSQITGKEFIEYLKEILDELFVAEVPHPETGELVEASLDSIIGEDWDEERLTDEEKERYEELFKLIELKRFCRYEHRRIFPYFQHEGRTVFVNYSERPYQSPEERYEEFQRLHSQYEHTFTEEQIELMDFEKREILVERFNEQFPENEKHMVNDMVCAMQDNMVDIGLFKIGNYEYNSYSVLNGFDGMIRIQYNEDCVTGTRMPFKTIYEQQEEIESERRERDLKLLKSNESMVYSDELDYSELLEKFKPARIKLTPEGKLPAQPSLSEAFKFLGFTDGKVLEEWEMNQICDALLKKYNRTGSGVGNFSNILSVSEYNTYNNRYTLKGVTPENVAKNDTDDNEEEKPYIPLPREKRRTTSRR